MKNLMPDFALSNLSFSSRNRLGKVLNAFSLIKAENLAFKI